ncbi:MAG: DUF4159 domain-containing protein [Nitrospinota bacterium]
MGARSRRSWTRREFCRALLAGGLGAGAACLWPETAEAPHSGGDGDFVFAQLRYRGGNWDPYPTAGLPLMEEVERRTTVEPVRRRHVVEATSSDVFRYPFLYMAGRYEFDPFGDEEVEALRRHLRFGGFLLADDSLGQRDFGFDEAMRRLVSRLFPRQALRPLPPDHAVYRSYYLIRRVVGRQVVNPYLEGVSVDDFTPVIYSQNDLGGAWARDADGRWLRECVPGGEDQRRDAFRLGVNLVIYALTENYKRDLVHHPFIRRRLNIN